MKIKILRKIPVCAILLIAHTVSLAQVNLVSNPSFEIIYSCPSGGDQIDSAVGWGTLISGGGGNPELYHTCCTYPFICGVPFNAGNLSFQFPHSGDAYAGIDAAICFYVDNFREYIQSKLKKGLSTGHVYCVKFYASLSDHSFAFIKPLGVYFDDGSVSALPPHGLAVVTPQVYNVTQPLNDTINWMKIEGSFVATGNEEYITIGNFFSDANSGIGFFGTPTSWGAYYYIDDVSVIDISLPSYAGNDTLIQPGDSVFIGRQPEIGLDEDCIWFVNGVPIDTVAGLWVQPDTTTTYVVQQTICGNVSWDTVTVSVYGTGIEGATHGLTRGFGVYPNPNTGTFTISLFGSNSITESAVVSIYNILGNKMSVFNLELQNNNATFDTKLSNGIYFISVKDSKGNIYNSEKIIVIK